MTEPTRAQVFGQRVAESARAAGYNIDGPRGGGQKALAEAAGMSHASVSRMLAGKALPDPYRLEALATALRVPVLELLELHGVISPGRNIWKAPQRKPTVPELADMWGIADPSRVKLLGEFVDFLVEGQGRNTST